MEKFLVVVECAIELDNKFLFIKRPKDSFSGGCLSFPGGKVEYNDGLEYQDILINAVKREILEEVSLDLIDPIHFVTSSHYLGLNNVNVLDNIFYCKLINSSSNVITSKREVESHYWMTLSEALSHFKSAAWLKNYISCVEKKREFLAFSRASL
jgi:8-oxo-dGTP pyrophosphatase MutT (NUDIX family)